MGFNHTHYVPTLKGRAGEYGALQAMTAEVKAALTPLIEIPPIPWDFDNVQFAHRLREYQRSGDCARTRLS